MSQTQTLTQRNVPKKTLTTQEQDKILRKMRRDNVTQRKWFRYLEAVLCLVFGSLHFYWCHRHYFKPWDMGFQGQLKWKLENNEEIMTCMHIVSGAGFFFVVPYLYVPKRFKKLYWVLSCAVSVAVFVYWAFIFWFKFVEMDRPFPWNLVWLPCGNIMLFAMCVYMEWTFTAFEKDVQKLDDARRIGKDL